MSPPIKRRDLGLVTDQVDGITETLEGQVQGNAEEADAERKAIMEDLENKFINMESDLKRLLNSVPAQNQNFREIDSFESSIISTRNFGELINFRELVDHFREMNLSDDPSVREL